MALNTKLGSCYKQIYSSKSADADFDQWLHTNFCLPKISPKSVGSFHFLKNELNNLLLMFISLLESFVLSYEFLLQSFEFLLQRNDNPIEVDETDENVDEVQD